MTRTDPARDNRYREMGAVLLADLAAPVALYYGLRALGVAPWLALLLGAAVPATRAVISLVRRRRVEWFAVLVLVLIVASSATSLLSGSPRFLLAKDGGITAALGLVVLATTASVRPAMFSIGRMTISRAGHDADGWDRRWDESAQFRRIWRVLTVLWGVGLLTDALLRVVLAYTLPIDVVPALSAAQWLILLVILQVISQIHLRRPGNRELIFD
ncbi:VC0807 family protein [Saccharopolyspora sp. 5N708]|uniref:VC0807 family protein n=1 Tax=Saccharopolyspora sp. 5N708 TaxID=3457424 RepID=UPI003FD49FF8